MHSKDKKREQLINEYFDLFRERVEPERHQLGLKLKHPLVEEFPEQLRLFLESRSELQTTVLEYAWHVYELHKMAYSCTTTDSAEDYWAELFVCLLDAKRHILTEYPESNRPLIRRLIYPNFEELTAPDIECGVKKAHWDKQNDKLALFEKAMAAADELPVLASPELIDKNIQEAIRLAIYGKTHSYQAERFLKQYAQICRDNPKITKVDAIKQIQGKIEITVSDQTLNTWITHYRDALNTF